MLEDLHVVVEQLGHQLQQRGTATSQAHHEVNDRVPDLSLEATHTELLQQLR